MRILAVKPYLEKHISSKVLITAGLVSVPAFLLQDRLVLQAVQVCLFIAAALLAGKQVRLLPTLIVLVSVSVLHLISPIGRVVLSFWRISITSGALYLGIQKSLTLVGLIFLSRATVRPNLTFPGRFGAVISRSFYFFDQINETWESIPKQKIIARLDALLLRIQDPGPSNGLRKPAYPSRKKENPPAAGATTFRGFILAGLFAATQWALFFLQYLIGWELFSEM